LGLNYFADWTVEEFRQKMLGTRLGKSKNEHNSSSLGVNLRLPKSIQLPDQVDWRYFIIII
jgi:hypothetical protein